MRRTTRTTWRPGRALAALALLAALSATGCGTPESSRSFPASESVAAFSQALWAQDEAGRWHLVSAVWDFEPELAPSDIRYQFQRGKVLTDGHFAEVLERLDTLKEIQR